MLLCGMQLLGLVHSSGWPPSHAATGGARLRCCSRWVMPGVIACSHIGGGWQCPSMCVMPGATPVQMYRCSLRGGKDERRLSR